MYDYLYNSIIHYSVIKVTTAFTMFARLLWEIEQFRLLPYFYNTPINSFSVTALFNPEINTVKLSLEALGRIIISYLSNFVRVNSLRAFYPASEVVKVSTALLDKLFIC